jgi:peptidoglycan hydrolase CwlO-like protein
MAIHKVNSTQIEQDCLSLASPKEELRTKDKYIQTTNENHTSSNEKLQSINEELKSTNKELQSVNKHLQKTLNEIKTLRGIVPICAHCKNIRDDKGFWSQVEVYIRNHSEADFSHGICPSCLTKHFPD